MKNDILDTLLQIEDPEKFQQFCDEKVFIPVAKKMIELDEECCCVTISLAQYWNDESDDAVHVKYIPSSTVFTSWEDLFIISKNPFGADNYGEDEETNDPYRTYFYGDDKDACEALFGTKYACHFDNNENFIRAYEKYCKEGASQEDSQINAYSPYIIVYKEENEIKVRHLGNIVRVWS